MLVKCKCGSNHIIKNGIKKGQQQYLCKKCKYQWLEGLPPDKSIPKILIMDIETAPLEVWTWGLYNQNISLNQIKEDWFMLNWAAKWLFDDNIMTGALTKKELLNKDDKRITEKIWKLFNEADIVIAHNACVEKNTPILMQDLTWKKAGNLKRGDKIIGFDEKTKPGIPRRNKNNEWNGNGNRSIKSAVVTNILIEPRHTLEVEFDNGDKIITTDDHYWLGMSENSRNQQWYRTDTLRIGQRVNKFISPWENETSYEAGWLSGFIEGEGTLKNNGASIDFCQRKTVVLDKALNYCKKLGIKLGNLKVKTGGLGRGDTLYTYTLGGKWKVLEILGKLRITRLINNIKWNKFGGLNSNAQNDTLRTIVNIKDVGINEVAVLETSTSTYIAGGYPMHNCKFDIAKLNSRFLKHDLKLPSPYQIIDTLKIARQIFRLTSNKLDYICQFLGVKGKIQTGGFELWKGCINGDMKSMHKMDEYCQNDVKILEEMYLKLRPYSKGHPNLALYMESDYELCPNCGSDRLQWGYIYNTKLNSYESAKCENCGAYMRAKKSHLTKEKKDLLLTN